MGSDELGEALSEVEKYGFRRDSFPLSLGNHIILILHNDGYEDEEHRLSLHLGISCRNCYKYTVIRGRSSGMAWAKRHVQDAKVLALGRLAREDCE